MFRWILLLASIASAGPDLFAPMAVDVLDSSGTLVDKIQITTLVVNQGDLGTAPMSFSATILSIGIDSVHLVDHNMPASYVLNAGFFITFRDTAYVLKGRFSINTQVDPLRALGEGGGQTLNNVRSQAFEFHPTIYRFNDTVVVYDTLRLRDTVRVTVRDTIRDTIRVGPPTLAKTASLAYAAPVASIVYDATGAKVWEGMLMPGAYPPSGLRTGLHLIVQGGQVRRFRIAYR